MAFVGAEHLRQRGPTHAGGRRPLIVALAILAIIVLMIVAVATLLTPRAAVAAVSASSSRFGSNLDALQSGGNEIVWRSADARTVGTWINFSWQEAQRLGRVVMASDGEHTFTSGRITFSDGSALLVTPTSDGEVNVDFPPRSVTWARFTIAGALAGHREVALSTLRFDEGISGGSASSVAASATASASSTAVGSSASALTDGNRSTGGLGLQWLADPNAKSASAEVRWQGERLISTVRIWGPAAAAFDPTYSAAAALSGRIRFSDGSSVRISGISGGSGAPTVVAFTPRMTTSATLVLNRVIPDATIGLRELQVGDVSTPRPDLQVTARTRSTVPELVPYLADCSGDTAASGVASAGTISLICPQIGAQVRGTATIRVRATPGVMLTASTDAADKTTLGHPASAAPLRLLTTAESDFGGTATLTFSTSTLPHGPFGLIIRSASDSLRPLHVQLLNGGGRPTTTGASSSEGRQLVWNEDFDGPVSAGPTDAEATYGTLKPEYWGGAQFGDAVFDTPDSGRDTFSLYDGLLRIRAQPLGSAPDPAGLGRTYSGGLLSSLRIGATGFSAQYGYYEARMLAPAGDGTWPAFWMMNTDAATKASHPTEVDAVELYGNRTKQTCHSIHNYTGKTDRSTVRCVESAIATDWAIGWHTYGVQISPGSAEFYVDGKKVMTQTGLTNSAQPFYFMADLALGGGWPINLKQAGDKADLWIDWIRVYV